MEEVTPQGIRYDWWLTGPDGARFELFPVRGVHTDQQVAQSKSWLRNEQDVVSIKVTWKDQPPKE